MYMCVCVCVCVCVSIYKTGIQYSSLTHGYVALVRLVNHAWTGLYLLQYIMHGYSTAVKPGTINRNRNC